MLVSMFPNSLVLIYDSHEIPEYLVFNAISPYNVTTTFKNDSSKRHLTVEGSYQCLYSILYDLTAYLVDTDITLF